MKKWIVRKEFEKEFAPFNKSGTQIWVITRVLGRIGWYRLKPSDSIRLSNAISADLTHNHNKSEKTAS